MHLFDNKKLFLGKVKFDYYIYIYIFCTIILTFVLKKDVFMLGNLVIVFAILSLFLLKNEKFLLFFSIIASLLQSSIAPVGTYIVMYAYIIILVYLLINKRRIKMNSSILIIGLITLSLSLLPLLVNGTTVPLIIISILKRFGFLIVFLFIVNINDLSDRIKMLLMKVIISLLIINFLYALVQFRQGVTQDLITGFFGSGTTGIIMYLFMFYIAILSGIHYKKGINTIIYLILVLIPLVYSAIAEVKIGFLTIPIVVVIYFVILNVKFKHILSLIVGGLALVQLYSVFVSLYPTHDFMKEGFINSYLTEGNYGDTGTINRIGFKSQIDTLVFNNNETEVLLGRGLGSNNPGSIELLQGEVYKKYDYLKTRWFALPNLYVESGILGTILFIILYLIPLLVAVKEFLQRKTALSIIIILMSITNFLFLLYNPGLLDFGVTTIYWVFIGFLFRRQKGTFHIKKEGLIH